MATKQSSVADSFIALFHHRWSLHILSSLYQLQGAKFVTLVNRLQISRDTLSQTLKALIQQGWVKKNPGYGHPMRPEYILTDKGQAISPICVELVIKIEKFQLEESALKKWSMPLLFPICKGILRFSELKEVYPEITPRALTQALKEMASAELVHRVVLETFPPSVEYRIAAKGLEFCSLLTKLVNKLEKLSSL